MPSRGETETVDRAATSDNVMVATATVRLPSGRMAELRGPTEAEWLGLAGLDPEALVCRLSDLVVVSPPPAELPPEDRSAIVLATLRLRESYLRTIIRGATAGRN